MTQGRGVVRFRDTGAEGQQEGYAVVQATPRIFVHFEVMLLNFLELRRFQCSRFRGDSPQPNPAEFVEEGFSNCLVWDEVGCPYCPRPRMVSLFRLGQGTQLAARCVSGGYGQSTRSLSTLPAPPRPKWCRQVVSLAESGACDSIILYLIATLGLHTQELRALSPQFGKVGRCNPRRVPGPPGTTRDKTRLGTP